MAKVDFTPSGKEVIHGRPSSYNNHGCRCLECTRAWAVYMKDRVKKWRHDKKKDPSKGVMINL